MNNRLVAQYNNPNNTNIPYSNNSILSNNPHYVGSVRDPNFHNRINMAKMEQVQKVKSIKDLRLDDKQILSLIINPIKIEKTDQKELESDFNKLNADYPKQNQSTDKNPPQTLKDLWLKRTNNPYKCVLKDLGVVEYTGKNYVKNEDLIVHKTTQLDKLTKIVLDKELDKLNNVLEKHNGELKSVYSLDNKNKYLEDFEYVNKYKNKIKYDPKNYAELKDYYKKEQKKINKEQKRIDDMIETLLTGDDITQEELNEIKQLQDKNDNTENTKISNVISLENVKKKIDNDSDEKPKKQVKKKIDSDSDSDSELKIQKKRIVIKKTETQDVSNTKISQADIEKYKNRKRT